MYVPVFMTQDRNPSHWTEPIQGKSNTFKTKNVGRPRDIVLKPFYKTHERRYSIYWDLLSEQSWKQRQKAYQQEAERKKMLEKITVDFVQPGERELEREHRFKGEKARVGFFQRRRYRESGEGWFSYDLKVFKGQPMALAVDYWGGYPGSKTFDILVEGEVIATENISNKKDGYFINVVYDIPDKLTFEKEKVTVTFKAQPGNTAGPVFGVRMIKR
jgi:uncharacterized protein